MLQFPATARAVFVTLSRWVTKYETTTSYRKLQQRNPRKLFQKNSRHVPAGPSSRLCTSVTRVGRVRFFPERYRHWSFLPGVVQEFWLTCDNFSTDSNLWNPNPATPISFSATSSELQDNQQLSRPFFDNFQAYLIVFEINCQPCPLGMIFSLQKHGNWKFKPYDHFKTTNGKFKLFSIGFLGWVVMQGSRYSR